MNFYHLVYNGDYGNYGGYGDYGYSAGYGAGTAVAMILMALVYLAVILVAYVWLAICLMKLAKKTNTPNGWMAWIPILNIYLMCKVAGKSGAWIFLFLIPFVNIIAGILIWMAIAERCGKPGWWGLIITLVPIVGIVMMGVLAFSKGTVPAAVGPAAAPSPQYAPPVAPPPPPPASPQPAVPSPPAAARPIPEGKKFCSQCGAEVDSATKFCPNCGAKL